MAMLRKPLHGWRIKQEIQKLTVIRVPTPHLNPVREWAGLASPPTPRSSLSPLPSLFFCCHNLPSTFPPLSTSSFATRPPSAVAYYSRAPEPDPDSAEDQLDEPNPNAKSQVDEDANMPKDSPQQVHFHGIPIPIEVANKMPKDSPRQEYVDGFPIEVANKMPKDSPRPVYVDGFPIEYLPLLTYWKKKLSFTLSSEERTKLSRAAYLNTEYTNLCEEALDHFYQEMSKEVETILHERDPRLPEELSRRVVVTCLSDDCDYLYKHVYVYVLRRKHRSRVSAAKVRAHGRKHRSQVRAAKESCRELEVELAMTYLVGPEAFGVHWPNDEFPFGVDMIPHKWKVVNKFEFSGEDAFDVAEGAALECAGWIIKLPRFS